MREILSKILTTTRLISNGQLSLPQSRSMALQVERLAQMGLESKAACRSRPAVAQDSASVTSVAQHDRQNDEVSTLSKRELEILTSLANGHSVHEVAALLGRSPKTVNNHRTNILHKLKLRNSAQLARFAIRNKLIKP